MTRPVGLQPDDVALVMATFGVAESQVRPDHAIPHILAAVNRRHSEELIFFGGTALSEDIDLIAIDQRDDLAGILAKEATNRGRQRLARSSSGIATHHGHPASGYVAVVRRVEDGRLDGSRRCP